MATPLDRVQQLDLVARLKSAYPELPDAPTPDLIDHERFAAYVKTPHDVGGEPDALIEYENKQYEIWEHNTYVLCEVLGWRGIWLSEERRRMGNVDLGRTIYLGLPYYGRWLLAVARVLTEKHHIGLSELAERMAEVKARYADGLRGKPLAATPKFEGDPAPVHRNRHHVHAVGKGDPRCMPGRPAHRSSASATGSWCAISPCCSTPAPRVCARRDGRDRGRVLRKPRRRGRDVGRPGPTARVVLHRPVQPLPVVARLHRARQRHPADRDPGTVARIGLATAAASEERTTNERRRTRSRAHRSAHGGRDHRLRSPRDRAARIVHREGPFTAEEHRRFTEFAEQIGPTPRRTWWRGPGSTPTTRSWSVRTRSPQARRWGRLAGTDRLRDAQRLHGSARPRGHPDAAPRDRLHAVFVLSAADSGQLPEWYRTPNYRRRIVRWPRQVLAEFGLILPEDVEIRVEDSNQKHRFMVLPVRPDGTQVDRGATRRDRHARLPDRCRAAQAGRDDQRRHPDPRRRPSRSALSFR